MDDEALVLVKLELLEIQDLWSIYYATKPPKTYAVSSELDRAENQRLANSKSFAGGPFDDDDLDPLIYLGKP